MALIVIASSLLLSPAAQAFEAKISGQVSRMVVLPDDAAGDEIQHVDIGWSGSRFRFTGSEEMDNGIKVGFRFEIQARSNSSIGVNGGNLGSADGDDFRYQDVYFSGGFGKISFGKGDGASNGSTEVDMSGTQLASAAPLQDNWGNFEIAPGVDWRTVYTMDDGLSRQNRVRYDTPNASGFSLAVSLNQALPLVLFGLAISAIGLRRALARSSVKSGKILGTIGFVISGMLAGLFCAYVFVISYWLPEPTATESRLLF